MTRCPLVLALAIAAALAAWVQPGRAGHHCGSEPDAFGRCEQHGRCTRPKLDAPKAPRRTTVSFGPFQFASSLAETDADLIALFSRNRQMTKMYSRCAISRADWEDWSDRLNEIMHARALQHAGAALELQQAQQETPPPTAPPEYDVAALFESFLAATQQLRQAMQGLEASVTSLGGDTRERVEQRSRRSQQILDDVVAASREREYAAGVLPRGGEPRGDPEAVARLRALAVEPIDFAGKARTLLAER